MKIVQYYLVFILMDSMIKLYQSEILKDKQVQTFIEANYCIVSEPGSTHMGHATGESGSSLDMFNSIYECVRSALWMILAILLF